MSFSLTLPLPRFRCHQTHFGLLTSKKIHLTCFKHGICGNRVQPQGESTNISTDRPVLSPQAGLGAERCLPFRTGHPGWGVWTPARPPCCCALPTLGSRKTLAECIQDSLCPEHGPCPSQGLLSFLWDSCWPLVSAEREHRPFSRAVWFSRSQHSHHGPPPKACVRPTDELVPAEGPCLCAQAALPSE